MNNKNLTTFFFKLVFFGLIGALIISILILPYAPDLGEDKKYTTALQKLSEATPDNDYDVLFFSNSYSFTAYDPTIIKERLGLNAIHLNSGAQRLEASLIVANEIIKEHTPQYMVFDVSGPTLPTPKLEDEEIWHYQTLAFQEIPFSIEKTKDVTAYFPIEKYTEFYVTAVSKKTGRIFRMNDLENYSKREKASYKTSSKSVYFSYNGFIANKQKSVEKEVYEKSFFGTTGSNESLDTRWSEDLISLMNRFLKETTSRNIKVIFINSLKMYPTVYNSKLLEGFVEKYPQVRFLDLNVNKDEYTLSEKDFYNSTHLNYTGSIQVTNRLVDSLSTWYSTSKIEKTELDFKLFKFKGFFYNLNEDEDKFLKLEFEDELPIELKNHQLVISLYPKDSTLLSDYAKKKHFKSDNFYVKIGEVEKIETGKSKIIIQRLNSKIDQNTLKKLKLYFYRPNDTLGLPGFDLNILQND
jgi:hypothetical protein